VRSSPKSLQSDIVLVLVVVLVLETSVTGLRLIVWNLACWANSEPRTVKLPMMWLRKCGQVPGRAFVPEGRDDSSLAVYCLECVQVMSRPVGYGVNGVTGAFCHRER
jgi:hypothetical protein